MVNILKGMLCVDYGVLHRIPILVDVVWIMHGLNKWRINASVLVKNEDANTLTSTWFNIIMKITIAKKDTTSIYAQNKLIR